MQLEMYSALLEKLLQQIEAESLEARFRQRVDRGPETLASIDLVFAALRK